MNILIYNNASGEILRSCYIGSDDPLISVVTEGGEAYIEGNCDDRQFYVLEDTIIHRPAQQTTLSNTPIIANGVDSGVLQNLPIPCTVFIENTAYEVTDGLLEFTLNLPGIYSIRVTNCFPYLDKEFTCEGITPV